MSQFLLRGYPASCFQVYHLSLRLFSQLAHLCLHFFSIRLKVSCCHANSFDLLSQSCLPRPLIRQHQPSALPGDKRPKAPAALVALQPQRLPAQRPGTVLGSSMSFSLALSSAFPGNPVLHPPVPFNLLIIITLSFYRKHRSNKVVVSLLCGQTYKLICTYHCSFHFPFC